MTDIPSSDTRRERDPVCGMSVRVEVAIEDGLTAVHDGHVYYFCRDGCHNDFIAAPDKFITSHRHSDEALSPGTAQIDEGMRRWYESCSCCLSDAYPDVKAALDAERDANRQPPVDPGICDVAEIAQGAPPASD